MNKIGLFGKITSHPGQRDALVKVLLEAATLMESVEGCELYIVNISDNEPEAIWVSEIWRDESDHKASLMIEETKEIIQRGRPLIAGFGEQTKLCPVGGKGFCEA
ncbi:antibiotic biosynthesis monooxygenase [Paenibacillus macquariensis subsp. defensor]|nr:antibiotic biosynthesis monooxygenase [Paenibacillus macquariensis subsp. defensor]